MANVGAGALGNTVRTPFPMDDPLASETLGNISSSRGRARAGTLPSTFHLSIGDGTVNDNLLPPGLGGAGSELSPARPDLLRRRLSGLPLGGSNSNSNNANGSMPLNGNTMAPAATGHPVNAELIGSLLRSSQPVSPDPIAAARLRSGSLTLPPSGLGNAFTPGVFGPPGSWTPRSSGLGTPLAMPSSSSIIPEEARSPVSGGASAGGLASPEDPETAASMGGILDFLGLQDSPVRPTSRDQRDQTRTRSPSQPYPSSSSHLSARRVSPTSSGLLVPARMHSGSLSVPSSTHPSIANLRQTYQDHESTAMSSSGSSGSDGSSMSPMTAARLRANTMAADPFLRKAPSFHFSSSASHAEPEIQAPTRTLADLALEEQNQNAASIYEAPGPTASSSAFLLNRDANRPRASTIGILDEAAASLSLQNRKRAGTTAGLHSSLRTPLYDGNADNYLESGAVAETEEEYEENVESSNLWYSNVPANPDPVQAYHGHSYPAPGQYVGTDRPGTPPPIQATRSLWIGNLDMKVTAQDLMDTFSLYGAIETVRMLPEKECAFVNYLHVQDAIQAKEDVLVRLGGQIRCQALGAAMVRIGFGKQDSAPPTPANALHGRMGSISGVLATPLTNITASTNGADHGLQTSPTRALWISSLPTSTSNADLLKVFSPYGAIESARVLINKQCGFCNYENLDDAVRARKALNGREIFGAEVGPVKIGFAKVPSKMPDTPTLDGTVSPAAAYHALKRLGGATAVSLDEQISGGHLENFRSPMALQLAANNLAGVAPHSATALTQSLQPAVGLSPSLVAAELDANLYQGVPMPDISEQQVLMRELSGDSADADSQAYAMADARPAVTYFSAIPPPTEDQYWARARNLDAPRLRDIRKRLEAPAQQVSQAEIDALTTELLDDIVPLASDYIGNVIVQKLFEKSSSTLRLVMLERIAPFLASIACHKNGTWAAQKIIDIISSPQEIGLVCRNLQPYVPAMLLDQFGNYAVQLCLRFFSPVSIFIFDAMVDRCWEIASGRFGARSMRTCLEGSNTTRLQQKRVAVAIILNSVLLAANANGALLLTWLLDTSNLPGRYRLLATRLAPHLAQLCPHKVASTTILKLINQKFDPVSAQLLLDALFKTPDSTILDEILTEQVHGSSFMFKLLGSTHIDPDMRALAVEKVRIVMQKSTPHHSPAYAKLCFEVGLPAPVFANQTPHTPPPGKLSARNGHYQSNGGHLTPGNPISPPFAFPAFGSPLSPHPANNRQGAGSTSPSPGFVPRPNASTSFQPMYGHGPGDPGMPPYGPEGYYYNPVPPNAYNPYAMGYGLSMSPAHVGKPQHTGLENGQQHHQMPASAGPGGPYSEEYMRNMAAMQMNGFAGYGGFSPGMQPGQYPPYMRFNPSPTYSNPGPQGHPSPQASHSPAH